MAKIVTRLFDNFSDAQHAVIELERIGVPQGDINLVSHKDDKYGLAKVREPRDQTAGDAAAKDGGIGAAAGGALGASGGVLAGLGLTAIPGLGPVVAAGWTGFDPAAAPYTENEVQKERDVYAAR
jgi:hypothetical protein